MTPREMLVPEPDPETPPVAESVTDWLVQRLLADSSQPVSLVVRLLLERREQGRERYGTELYTRTGRRARVDLVQELTDAALYAAQDMMERPSGRSMARLGMILGLLGDLASELEEVPSE
jgi:hypothetical protein